MFEKKNLLIGAGVLVGLYLLNPYVGSSRGSDVSETQFTHQSEQLKIINFVGKVELTKSADAQIHIQVSNIQHGFTPQFDNIAGKVEVSGSEVINSSTCGGFSLFSFSDEDELNPKISINGGSDYRLSEYPILRIQAPKNTNLTLNDSIIVGQFSNIGKLAISSKSCSLLEFAEIGKDLRIVQRGSGKISIDKVGGTADVSLRGSGDVSIGKLMDDSVSVIQGSGNIHYASMSGISKMTVRGSGDIEVGFITGDAELLVQGSGDIDIADGDLNWFIASVLGSGNVEYDGAAANFRSSVKGSGNIDTKF